MALFLLSKRHTTAVKLTSLALCSAGVQTNVSPTTPSSPWFSISRLNAENPPPAANFLPVREVMFSQASVRLLRGGAVPYAIMHLDKQVDGPAPASEQN